MAHLSHRELLALSGITLVVFVWSGFGPVDRLTWVLEVFPVVGAAVVLTTTYRRFPLTRLAYWLIVIHAIILRILRG